jgi:hypothetical protein
MNPAKARDASAQNTGDDESCAQNEDRGNRIAQQRKHGLERQKIGEGFAVVDLHREDRRDLVPNTGCDGFNFFHAALSCSCIRPARHGATSDWSNARQNDGFPNAGKRI